MQDEVFIQLPNYPDYFISNLGRVKRRILKKGNNPYEFKDVRLLVEKKKNSHYLFINIVKDGVRISISVPMLVARTFLPKKENSSDVLKHLDGDYFNNNVNNLKWRPKLSPS